ncbi:MAG TPA: hypothetical protein VNL70_01470, partial [Tepidisphaeraceae bacterium]|nr:hypothetical protein [Tepidisphaeraceae bacterium]
MPLGPTAHAPALMRIPAPPRCLTLLSCLLLLISVASVKAQYQPPSDYLLISADRAYTWTEGSTNVVQLQGPLTIQTDRALLSADRAVIWLTPVPGTVLDQQRAEIALLGNARLEQPQQQVLRSGQVLFIETQVRGTIRITANARIAQNLSDTDLYRDASSLRPVQNLVPGSQPLPEPWMIPRPWLAPPMPAPAATAPTTRPVRPPPPVSFRFQNAQTVQTPEDRVALVLSGDVLLMQTDDNGDRLELRAERAVLFTPLRSLRELGQAGQFKTIEQAITAAYLEGDVRIVLTPRPRRSRLGEQRLRAQRVYYDFTTDR